MSLPVLDKDRIATAVGSVLRSVLTEYVGGPAFGLSDARRLAELGEDQAKALGVPVVLAIADEFGGLMLMHRMDGSLPASVDIAINKAYSAAAFRLPTHELGALAQPGQLLYGVHTTNQGRVVLFGGGYPCRQEGRVLGAIGVSGGSVEQDMQIARHALHDFFEETGRCLAGGKKYE
jgi:uncharacterized protein GlcG (DUF336 family)